MEEHEMLGRALVARSGLTRQARGRLTRQDSFRFGGPRLLNREYDMSEEKGSHVATRYQPLPEREPSDLSLETRSTEPTDVSEH